VVTPVSLDHTRMLGDTVEQIADEKSGIIKADAVAVIGVQEPEVTEIMAQRAESVGARIAVEGNDFGLLTREVAVGGQQISVRGLGGDYEDLLLPLHGAHQAHNTVLAIAAVEAFLGGGEQRLDPDIVRAGIAAVASPGRLEIVRRSPTVLVDAAHNPAGALALRAALEDSFNFARIIGVVAILKDKDATEMLEILDPVLDHVVVSRTTSPRAMRPDELGQLAVEIFGEDRVTVVQDLPDALDTAAGLADEGGVGGGVLATGSVTTAAEVRMLLGATDV
jgi:dihydrofolate synthase/folylpolyglutamate synthase